MDDIQKNRVRLTHWINHNNEHLTGYIEMAGNLEGMGLNEAAENVHRAISLVKAANHEFERALTILGGSVSEHGHNHTHAGHEHSHDHGHHHHGPHSHDADVKSKK
jgi:hypothetical protein